MAEPDPTALTAQLDAAVRQHLPEKVGKLLRERLDQLEALEAQIATQAKRIGLLDIKAKAAENIARREEDVARREEDVAAVEAELAERHQVISTRLHAGRTVVRVLSHESPGDGFEAVCPDLEDAYFSSLAGPSRMAA